MNNIQKEKIDEINSLTNIPYEDGKQFISVQVNIKTFEHGTIVAGFDWKNIFLNLDFSSLDECIEKVLSIRKEYYELLFRN